MSSYRPGVAWRRAVTRSTFPSRDPVLKVLVYAPG